MAGIDKIYGTQAQYDILRGWLEHNRPDFLPRLVASVPEGEPRAIANFTREQDAWLYANCPLEFVKESIEWQYNGSPVLPHRGETP